MQKRTWVLILEEDKDYALKLKEALEARGFSVLTCSEAGRAGQMLLNQRFACVIVDPEFRGKGGQLIATVKRNVAHPNYGTPFMVTMSAAPHSETLRVLRPNIKAAFLKPCCPQQVSDRVGALLGEDLSPP